MKINTKISVDFAHWVAYNRADWEEEKKRGREAEKRSVALSSREGRDEMPKRRLGYCSIWLLCAPKGALLGENLWLQWEMKWDSLKVLMRRIPRQWKFPGILQVLSHLQDDFAQILVVVSVRISDEVGLARPPSVSDCTRSCPLRRNKYFSKQTGIAVWILSYLYFNK